MIDNKSPPKPVCIGCSKHPDQLPEYVEMANDYELSPDEYVRQEEGTYNRENGHFTCTDCYVAMGMPSLPGEGWKAP